MIKSSEIGLHGARDIPREMTYDRSHSGSCYRERSIDGQGSVRRRNARRLRNIRDRSGEISDDSFEASVDGYKVADVVIEHTGWEIGEERAPVTE